jgi:uncharacterized membrane protein YbhN (UPF0104 family)
MRINIDVLMIVLLVVFISSFLGLIIYGEIWRIRLPTTDVQIESFDRGRTQNAFILSCVAIACGASMLYVADTQFPDEQKAK